MGQLLLLWQLFYFIQERKAFTDYAAVDGVHAELLFLRHYHSQAY